MAHLRLFPLLLLIALAGCASRPWEDKVPFTPGVWKQGIVEDARRNLTEDQRAAGGTFGFLHKTWSVVDEIVTQAYNLATGKTPVEAAKSLFDPDLSERRRNAIVYLSDRPFGRKEPYTKYFMEMARTDEEPRVRAQAIRALNRARDRSAMALYLQAITDRNPLVKLEAAKALANMPDAQAVPLLLKLLQDPDENVDVRVACADALRHYRTAQVATALVSALRGQFAVSWQARVSLKLMTGKDFRYDRAAWLNYLTGPEKPVG